MAGKILITCNPKDLSVQTASILSDKLMRAGYEPTQAYTEDCELIIAVGGDGSFLKTIHDLDFPKTPLIGVNTGHLGFFQDVLPHQIDTFIEAYQKNDYIVQSISPLQASVCTRDQCFEFNAVNEIVVKGDKSRTIHINVSVDGSLIEYFSGDGLLISTATGSTAYNYSSGGAIVDPALSLIQLSPLAPMNTNAYRSFTSSIIFSRNAILQLSPEYRFEDTLLIVCDGIEYKHEQIVKIFIQTSPKSLNLLRFGKYNFWNKVKEKFL